MDALAVDEGPHAPTVAAPANGVNRNLPGTESAESILRRRPVNTPSPVSDDRTSLVTDLPRQQLRQWLRAAPREQLEELRRRIRVVQSTKRLYHFFVQAWHVVEPGQKFEPGWHIAAICDHIQAQLEDRERAMRWIQDNPAHEGDLPEGAAMRAQDFAINVPPRTLKTAVLTCATAWAWIRWPTLHMMYMSTNPDVSTTSARKFRDLVSSQWYRETFRPTWELRGDQEALSAIGNTAGGVRRARGLAAKVTGTGAHWLIIDDPHDLKDSEDAIASTVADYKGAVHNRINDPRTSIRTLIMQRVSASDLTASHPWAMLVLPMEYEPHRVGGEGKWETIYGFRDPREARWRAANDNQEPYEAETIHPRFTPAFLASSRISLSGTASGYAGQMQQRPAPAGGNLFKRKHWKFWKVDGIAVGTHRRPEGCTDEDARTIPIRGGIGGRPQILGFEWLELWVDCAFKGGKQHDNVSLQLVAGIGHSRFVVYDWTKNRDIDETLKDIQEITAREGLLRHLPAFGHLLPSVSRVLVEDKANGPAVVRLLRDKVAGLTEYSPGQDSKESRAQAIVPGHRAGDYYLLEGAEWLEEYVQEFDEFPRGKKDDRVDAFDEGVNYHAEDQSAGERAEAASRW